MVFKPYEALFLKHKMSIHQHKKEKNKFSDIEAACARVVGRYQSGYIDRYTPSTQTLVNRGFKGFVDLQSPYTSADLSCLVTHTVYTIKGTQVFEGGAPAHSTAKCETGRLFNEHPDGCYEWKDPLTIEGPEDN